MASRLGRLVLAKVVSPGDELCEDHCGDGWRRYWLRFYILLSMTFTRTTRLYQIAPELALTPHTREESFDVLRCLVGEVRETPTKWPRDMRRAKNSARFRSDESSHWSRLKSLKVHEHYDALPSKCTGRCTCSCNATAISRLRKRPERVDKKCS